MHETLGELKPAVERYLKNELLSSHDILLIRDYLLQWIDAPVWPVDQELERLRKEVRSIVQRKDIDLWIDRALNIGMDPL
jgi:hypothetical protein